MRIEWWPYAVSIVSMLVGIVALTTAYPAHKHLITRLGLAVIALFSGAFIYLGVIQAAH